MSATADPVPQPGRRISHYEIQEKLGEGGMGVVYRAVDLRLERSVALKILPPDKTSDAVRRSRFVREAKAASALNHPNIVTIHEIETADGQDFIAMEYVPGRTLWERLAQKPMELGEALRYAIQVAEALSAAHQAGIIHRDLKPANIMITPSGGVKLLDFGLAKLIPSGADDEAAATRTIHTSAGEIVGTVAYMSPEQAQGLPLDARSDIFSFGTVLFQMLTGRIPFDGANTLERMYAVAHAPPPPLAEICPRAPASLAHVVNQALEKDPARRPQTMAAVVADLKACAARLGDNTVELAGEAVPPAGREDRRNRLPRAALAALAALVALAVLGGLSWRWFHAPPGEQRIAVLPFRNIGNQPANQAFCDGVMETVSSSLTQMEQFHGALWVVPASEVLRESITSAHDAARALGVNLAITGSVQRDGDSVRVTSDLIDARTLKELRSRQVSRSLSELAGLQDWVIQATAEMLDVELRPQARQALAGGATSTPGAYDLYLQAEGHLQRRERNDLERAAALFKEAVARDPGYALAYAGLGEAYWRLYRATRDARYVEPARANGRRALELSDRIPAAYRTMGMIESGSGQHDAAMQALQRSLQLDPASSATCIELGATCEAMGLLDNAEKYFRQAADLHPGDWSSLNNLALFYYRHARYAEAAPLLRRGIELAPDNNSLYTNLGAVHWMAGEWKQAAASWEKSLQLRPSASAYTNVGTAYFFQGECLKAAGFMAKAVDLQPSNDSVWANLGDAYACAGSADKAGEAYERAVRLAEDRLAVNPKDAELIGSLGLYRARLGERGMALPLTQKALSLAQSSRAVQWHAALAYELCGRRDLAMDALAAAIRLGQPRNEVRNEPALAGLRADPKYRSVLDETVR